MRLPRLRLPARRHQRDDTPVEVRLPFAVTRWEPIASPPPAEPAVTLGFRDGSMVEVAPESAEGQALRTAAAALVDRNDTT